MDLIIISTNFPEVKSNAEYNLLKTQFHALNSSFRRKFVIPTGRLNYPNCKTNPDYELINNFRNPRLSSFLSTVIASLRFIKYLIRELNSVRSSMTLNKLVSIIYSYVKAVYTYTFMVSFFKKFKVNTSKTIIYSFWFDDYTLGALLLKKSFPMCKVLAGAHGHDLYPNRHPGNRIPFRNKAIEVIDRVLADSKEGALFLKRKYSEYSNKIALLNSGVVRKPTQTKFSNDGILRIITLSRTHPVKRIGYLLKMLKKLENTIDYEIQYFHIGGGQELDSLKNLKDQLGFKKFKIKFKGYMSDAHLKDFFEHTPLDIFLNVSYSEGTSMALIEAMSYGIPVLVTDVGGNKEIGSYCKSILSVDFMPTDLEVFFNSVLKDDHFRQEKKERSLSYWQKHHDVEVVNQKLRKVFIDI